MFNLFFLLFYRTSPTIFGNVTINRKVIQLYPKKDATAHVRISGLRGSVLAEQAKGQ